MSYWRPISLLIVLLAISCSDSTSSVLDKLHPIHGGIQFALAERSPHPDSAGTLRMFLTMHTDEIYGCCNYSLIQETVVGSDELTVALKGVYKPDVCATALGPAASSQILDIPDGHYTLRFTDNNRTDSYDLEITESSIAVNPLDTTFTATDCPLFWRPVPNSFAYLCGTTTETSWMCDDFLDSLLSNLSLTEITFPDSGEVPFPRSSSGHYYDAPGRYFVYTSDDDFIAAGRLLESFTKNVIAENEGIGLTLMNWKNDSYHSWLFE